MDSADNALMESVGRGYLPGRYRIGVDSSTKGSSMSQLLGNGVVGSSDSREREVCNRAAATSGVSKRAKSAPSSGQSLTRQFRQIRLEWTWAYLYSRPSVPHTHPLPPIINCSSPSPDGEVFRRSSLAAVDPLANECDVRVVLSRIALT